MGFSVHWSSLTVEILLVITGALLVCLCCVTCGTAVFCWYQTRRTKTLEENIKKLQEKTGSHESLNPLASPRSASNLLRISESTGKTPPSSIAQGPNLTMTADVSNVNIAGDGTTKLKPGSALPADSQRSGDQTRKNWRQRAPLPIVGHSPQQRVESPTASLAILSRSHAIPEPSFMERSYQQRSSSPRYRTHYQGIPSQSIASPQLQDVSSPAQFTPTFVPDKPDPSILYENIIQIDDSNITPRSAAPKIIVSTAPPPRSQPRSHRRNASEFGSMTTKLGSTLSLMNDPERNGHLKKDPNPNSMLGPPTASNDLTQTRSNSKEESLLSSELSSTEIDDSFVTATTTADPEPLQDRDTTHASQGLGLAVPRDSFQTTVSLSFASESTNMDHLDAPASTRTHAFKNLENNLIHDMNARKRTPFHSLSLHATAHTPNHSEDWDSTSFVSEETDMPSNDRSLDEMKNTSTEDRNSKKVTSVMAGDQNKLLKRLSLDTAELSSLYEESNPYTSGSEVKTSSRPNWDAQVSTSNERASPPAPTIGCSVTMSYVPSVESPRESTSPKRAAYI